MMKVIYGDHIVIWEHNKHFSHITEMMLHLFDTKEYSSTLFVLGSYIYHNRGFFQRKFPDHKVIVYQLEQLAGNTTGWNNLKNILINLETFDHVWDMDDLNVAFLKQYTNVKVERVLPVCHTPTLKSSIISNINPQIDILFYGFLSERRGRVFRQLHQELYKDKYGLNIVTMYGGNPYIQDCFISNSKIILNIHGHEPWFRQEQPRIFYPLINGKLVVSEKSQYNYFGDSIIEADLKDLSKTLTDIITNDTWKTLAKKNAKKFKTGDYELIKNY